MFELVDYHGFGKARFPEALLTEVLTPHKLTAEEVQIEVVKVEKDLTSEVHYHEETTAYCVVLGRNEHFPSPYRAKAFLGIWITLVEGDVLSIPIGEPHGFTVGEDGHLYFLSVQSPPILRGDGHEDYIRTTG